MFPYNCKFRNYKALFIYFCALQQPPRPSNPLHAPSRPLAPYVNPLAGRPPPPEPFFEVDNFLKGIASFSIGLGLNLLRTAADNQKYPAAQQQQQQQQQERQRQQQRYYSQQMSLHNRQPISTVPSHATPGPGLTATRPSFPPPGNTSSSCVAPVRPTSQLHSGAGSRAGNTAAQAEETHCVPIDLDQPQAQVHTPVSPLSLCCLLTTLPVDSLGSCTSLFLPCPSVAC